LILCAETSWEQVELLEMYKDGIIVAEYWTELPQKRDLEKRLHTAIIHARELPMNSRIYLVDPVPMKKTSRILNADFRKKVVTADEAAAMIPHGVNIGFSGFTGAGYPKGVPLALARRIRVAAEKDKRFRIGVWTGASTGRELDGALAEAGGISRRLPYQADSACRDAINQGKTEYADYHLGSVGMLARSGCFGKLDFAVVEVAKILADGRLVPGTSVGNNQTWLDLAGKVILEVNSWHDEKIEGLHDITTGYSGLYPIAPVPVNHPCDRIGTPYFTCPSKKIIAIVETCLPDRNSRFTKPDEASRNIAGYVIDFLQHEVRRGRMPSNLLPLQTGVGNISNAVMAGFEDAGFSGLSAWTEVIQDSMLNLILNGVMTCASATAFSLSPGFAEKLNSMFDRIRQNVVLRPQDISNHPEIIRRLGCISINSMIETDIYGNVNSSCVMGSKIQNGIGGSGDFARMSGLSFFVSPSTAKNKAISCIVPMTPHVDHPDHDVRIIVTEQGIADLRGLSPKERAKSIIKNCAHPDFRPALADYFKRSLKQSFAGHMPHILEESLSWHRRFIKTGSMAV
jgi:succinyl-CoA:acetate CoA-transferase